MEVLQNTYKDTKIGRIPKDWKVVKLVDLFKLSSGRGLSKKNMIDGNFPVYGGNGISGYHNDYFIEEPTIVIGRVGEYCGSVHLLNENCWITDNGLYVTKFLNEVNLRFLVPLLQRMDLNRYSKVGGQPSISQTTVTNLSIPFPPLTEQKKIAAILSTVDEQISTTEKIIEKSKELKKGLMQKLFSEGIGHTEFKHTKIGRIPKDWEVMMLNEIGDIKVGRDLNKGIYSSKFNKEHRVPVYSNAITNKGLYGFYNTSEYPPKSITITGRGYIGYAFQRDEEFGAIGRLIVIQPNSNVDYVFLTNYINQSVNFHIETSGIPQLTGVQASKYKVAIPPLKEQQKISIILLEADAKIEKEQKQKAQLEQLKKGLMQQLLTGKKRVKV